MRLPNVTSATDFFAEKSIATNFFFGFHQF